MVFRVLSRLGLTDAEIRVYTVLVEKGESTVGPIIEDAQVSSSKIYDILTKLKAKGLVSEVIHHNVRSFQAVDPAALIAMFEEKEREIAVEKRRLQEHILPMFEKRRQSEKSQVKVYEGAEGIKMALAYMLEVVGEGDEYCTFTFDDNTQEAQHYGQFIAFHHRRKEKGITIRALATVSQKKELDSFNLPGVEFRYTTFDIPHGLVLFKDHVMNFIFSDPVIVVVIKSRENYEDRQKFFNSIWEGASSTLVERNEPYCAQCARCRQCSGALDH